MSGIRSIFTQTLFTNKVAIVTGGATGIGAAIAKELCYLGCNIMIASRKEMRLKEAAIAMRNAEELKGDVETVKCDIRKEEDVKNLMTATLKRFGKIDYLVNNGGGQFTAKVQDISLKGWNAVIDTNLNGTFNCCKYAYLSWMQDHGGAIVNISADVEKGCTIMPHTGAARAAVNNLTKTLSLEWAKNGVRINTVAPGVIYSPTAVANYPDGERMFQNISKLQPTCRLGKPEEVSSAVCFLLSPAASYITGEILKVDGAQSLHVTFIKIPKHNNFPVWSWDDPAISNL